MFKETLYRLCKQKSFYLFLICFYYVSIQPLSAQKLIFPLDDGKHEKVDFEAWSLLTHLSTVDSSRFGVAIFFFTGKVVGINASGIYVMITEQKKDEYEEYSKIQFPLINQTIHTEGYLLENYSDNILKRKPEGGSYFVNITKDDFNIELEFNPSKKPVDMGNLSVGDKGFNRIYAVPKGNVSAIMNFKGKKYKLSGIGVFQHQWGDKPKENMLNDMFALHLNDRNDILIYHSNSSSGTNKMLVSNAVDTSIVLNEFFAKADSLVVVKSTGDEFKLNWLIKSPENQIEINIIPTSVHQEIEMLDMTYWFARCKVTGNIKGVLVSGVGYVYIKKNNIN